MCGSVKFPSDDGASILQSIQQLSRPSPIWHQWCCTKITTFYTCLDHILRSGRWHHRPRTKYFSSRTCGLLSPYSSSSRAELKTAFLASCVNQGMIKKCSSNPSHRLRIHREANNDLFLVQRFYSNRIKAQFKWDKGLTYKELWKTLEQLKSEILSTEEMVNMCCDRMASNQWKIRLTLCLTLMYHPRNSGYLFRSSYSSQIIWQYVHWCPQCIVLGIHCYLHSQKTRLSSSKLQHVNTATLQQSILWNALTLWNLFTDGYPCTHLCVSKEKNINPYAPGVNLG